jgi:energy-coupling factor transport system permease protein
VLFLSITNITIGQFYPTESIIHRLDSRLKLSAIFIYISLLFIYTYVASFLLAILGLSIVIKLSKIPLNFIFRGLKHIFFILLFTMSLNALFTPGVNVLFSVGSLTVTLEGVAFAIRMAVRLVLLIIASSLLTLTTTPISLTDAIEYMLKPFKKIGVPSHEIAMMMTIALRFIPTLLEEMDKIMKAQMSRGATFDTGGLISRAKSFPPLLIPLFISSFRRADELAIAMESRCYRGDYNRTRMKKLKFQKIDFISSFILILFIIAMIGTSFI